MTKLLVIDTETGGVDPALHSLLSIGVVVWNDGELGPECDVAVLEDPLVVTPRAMEINQIDLAHHGRIALSPKDAAARLLGFVREAFALELERGEKVTLVGHNVGFDVAFLKRLFDMAGVAYESTFSHRMLDTASVLKFLALAGRAPADASSSDVAFAHFGVEIPVKARHSATGDARGTARLLTRLLETQLPAGRRAA